MPTFEKHVDQAIHNLSFLNTFANTYAYKDWAVTVSFYTSVHLIEAVIFKAPKIKLRSAYYLINHSADVNNHFPSKKSPHWCRKIIVMQNYREIGTEYYSLYQQSENARYYCYGWSKGRCKNVLLQLQKIIEWFNKMYPDHKIENSLSL